ncbi:hypothetical protein HQ48_05210 [Porphyromonas sp. COT-290 OH3588]|nr:hypothetical protein HQ48_05210 [Porphyromonas sp. COT-290 OH3588]
MASHHRHLGLVTKERISQPKTIVCAVVLSGLQGSEDRVTRAHWGGEVQARSTPHQHWRQCLEPNLGASSGDIKVVQKHKKFGEDFVFL